MIYGCPTSPVGAQGTAAMANTAGYSTPPAPPSTFGQRYMTSPVGTQCTTAMGNIYSTPPFGIPTAVSPYTPTATIPMVCSPYMGPQSGPFGTFVTHTPTMRTIPQHETMELLPSHLAPTPASPLRPRTTTTHTTTTSLWNATSSQHCGPNIASTPAASASHSNPPTGYTLKKQDFLPPSAGGWNIIVTWNLGMYN